MIGPKELENLCKEFQEDIRPLDESVSDYFKDRDSDLHHFIQLDSEEDIYWGDDGLAHLFIVGDDLESKDFSKMIYTWDCY